ncbi:MAG TPA: 1-(5-phosphoribosyl)-5-((5-phosphoribosylamino)methylideneamino)imidazole-4-carboxamide isomerase [Hungateiclostridium thermocellum]|jgi:phosphoribosylformimino-5-aminoimidazole carboxamide ribotide isomerase|uniref:1-(5-phosphoribosyl)-5-[(5-phosphoribosylamino)methylideneamino] imidazole-4-carboxamide isomerase n=2 Tax=Acetivibrio thermocellus TaxID=1515 RepID=HIS4_ACET2|nr:1-(5-phosphoribosyl)-5-[(5-phosphoribosylamino)methylideneamino]imidazole-4-carboxamide isomerase [Acetivibrio thermocellus]A3DJF6.1 RecName: Full=1-(5-phosphoribosyl)-5-[(5-phosphoribosylamino)methylideneamino] imidazole-4-carboxamide isomerase; AltName: Full=Phosphoribosylformimino-5-aminoimidazole carboxamide ribotide isomerase [Acetivibrio thermocellus ATCC 27405]CDG37378.1 1-(5-phosphoribosyl)-5-[(5-phosphoribosylamino)methylideneamino] imidazole-4-carboxamide isomerase [Acetivibrio therm
MIIYPAVDIKDGRCVRLVQGEFDKVTVYSDNPVEMGLKWERMGAQYLHVVDLDGARTGQIQNTPIISEMAVKLGIPVQLGGGIRTVETIETLLCKGIHRVILGTSAVKNPELVKQALKTFEDSVVIGIDAKDGMVAIEGWAKTSEFTAIGFAKKMEELGAKTIIYTDISRDGMLAGPNLKAMEEMVKAVNIEVIASGGVRNIDDIRNLKNVGVSGVIVGKALYTGDLDLKEAIEVAK